MTKPWLASYPPGVPPEIDAHAFASLNALFEQSFSRFRERPAVTNYGVTLTYADIERRKDVIVVSGFKVYTREIEDVALLHPGVRDAGAVGIADAKRGEAVAVFIVRKDAALTVQALREHFATHLARYKQPRHIEFRDALPKSPIGKVLHRELKSQR